MQSLSDCIASSALIITPKDAELFQFKDDTTKSVFAGREVSSERGEKVEVLSRPWEQVQKMKCLEGMEKMLPSKLKLREGR